MNTGFTAKRFIFPVFCLVFLSFAMVGLASSTAHAEGYFKPYFASLRSAEVNMRTGPGYRYPISWVYRVRHLPVRVVDSFEHWRKIQDQEGDEGWVHTNLLSDRQSVVVQKSPAFLTKSPTDDAIILAEAEIGVIGRVEECRYDWCMVDMTGYTGWITKSVVWGVE